MICPFAIWRPGPVWKVNGADVGTPWPRSNTGAVLHSSEGNLAGAFRVLDGPAELSWHFTVAVDGTLFQHYDSRLQCWHAHAAGNVAYVGIEHENEYSNGSPNHWPITDAQVDTDRKLIRWLSTVAESWAPSRGYPNGRKTLWEHNEVPGNATACPSGRIRWADILAQRLARLTGLGVRLDDGTDMGPILPPIPDGRFVLAVGAEVIDGDGVATYPRLWPAA
jgi:hypothetical protein